ncbi:unnamed protein product [Acanthoscelides obtectus]|uniref:Uncharacterized protein n=1 Tax=Acanthoscelides obtectus TaxID=200917 RepID=A0A9P0M0M7_ACAOB|nr:unnamed protein product [Acanthoscelides obtectus]CAK1680549.1 hypothetical protein AOBTE_LOCUS32749 [Acanthoscelides obtectus]
MSCFEILKVYIKLVYESPVAKYRRVNINLSVDGIASLNFVSCFAIFGPISFNNHSKSVDFILQKFTKSPYSISAFRSLIKSIPLYRLLLLNNDVVHQRRFRRFLGGSFNASVSASLIIIYNALAIIIFSSSDAIFYHLQKYPRTSTNDCKRIRSP